MTREPHGTELAILFVDISDSTRLYETLGDAAARDTIVACLSRLGDVVGEHAGTVIDRIGDELMCTFASADEAANASIALQAASAAFGVEAGDEICIRVGIHHGAVILEDGRAFGGAVHAAKRAASIAKPRQIIVTAAALDRLSTRGAPTRFVEHTAMKGFAAPVDLHEIIWDPSSATDGAADPKATRWAMEIILRLDDVEVAVNAERPVVTLGRRATSDIVVAHRSASQLHARVSSRKRRVYLADLSTNGSYVRFDPDGDPVFVHRDTLSLSGSGRIGLGADPSKAARHAISFECRIVG